MSFAYPVLAIAALVAFFAYLAIFAALQRKRKALLSKFAAAALLPALEVNLSKFKVRLKGICVALAIMFIMLALARPQWGYKWEEQKHIGLDVVFAVDTSKSMLAEDIKPNRLERSKLAISDILDRLDGDRVGLVAFSGQAFLQCPLTLDYGAFKMSLEALDTNIIQRGGTNIATAIDEADSAFAKTPNQKIIILISDGEELESSGIARAEKISKEQNVKIFTLGVGSTTGEPIPVRDSRGNLTFLKDENGKLVSSILNEDLLKKVAQATGGFYASLAENGMDEIFENGISKEVKSELSSKMKKIAIERFQIPLAIAIAIIVFELILGTRRTFARRGLGAASSIVPLLALALLAPNFADAQTAEAPGPEDLFNSGVDAFNAKDFKKAKDDFYASIANSYDLKMQAKAYYNIANTNYEEAKALCEKSPSAKEAEAKALQDISGAEGAIAQGRPALQKGLDTLKKSGEEGLKEKSLQDQLKQSLQACEGAKKALEENSKSQGEVLSSIKNVQASANLARKNYENAVELDPEFESAKENLKAANAAIEKLASLDKQFEEISKAQKKYGETLQKLIEELKKLIRDENNQNNQDKNNQQNNQNQQNQDNQQNRQNNQNQQNNQQNQQQNNQNQQDNQDKQNQQQNQQQNNQNQDSRNNQQNQQNQNNEQRQNNKQDQENRQNDQQNQGRENKQDKRQNDQDKERQNSEQNKADEQENQNQEQNKPDEENQESQNKPENGEDNQSGAENEGKDKDSQDEPRDSRGADKKDENASSENPEQSESQNREQAVQSGLDKPENSEKKEAEAAAPSEAEETKAEAAKAAAEAAEKADENSQDFRAAAGVMTRREAGQVLDSLKDNEKKLPFRGYGNQRRRYEDKNYKDW